MLPTQQAGLLRGDVQSLAGACEAHRRVVIKKRRGGSDVPVGETHTDRSGYYEITVRLKEGVYYAQVRGENRGAAETPCKGDRSPKITVAPPPPSNE